MIWGKSSFPASEFAGVFVLNDAWAMPSGSKKGGFYHDGRFPTLLDVVNRYDGHFGLGLTPEEKADLVQYLLSL